MSNGLGPVCLVFGRGDTIRHAITSIPPCTFGILTNSATWSEATTAGVISRLCLARRVSTMCGIVGYIGPREAGEFLLRGLRRLEYRGYDSSGVVTITPE